MAVELVSTVTVGSGGAASIQWTSIPQTGKTLWLLMSSRITAAVTNAAGLVQINGDSGTKYSWVRLLGTGAVETTFSTTSATGVQLQTQGDSTTASAFDSQSIYFPNYTGSLVKTMSIEGGIGNNASTGNMTLFAGTTAGTGGSISAAISSITIVPADPFVQHTVASLYIIS